MPFVRDLGVLLETGESQEGLTNEEERRGDERERGGGSSSVKVREKKLTDS